MKQQVLLLHQLIFQRLIASGEFGQSTGFDYTRTKNPNSRSKAEEVLAAIESAHYALQATSSGMSAIVLAFMFLSVGKQGFNVPLYGGSFSAGSISEQ